MNLWRLYNSATAYGKRPSDFFELETEIAAWALDEACLTVGRHVENNLNQNKPAFEGLDQQIAASAPARGYASAKKRVRKKVKIKPDGTW